MVKIIYWIVAALDVMAAGLFFGPVLSGFGLRFIPKFDDLLPLISLWLAFVSFLLLVALLSRKVRVRVVVDSRSRLSLFIVSVYVIVVAALYGSFLFGGM